MAVRTYVASFIYQNWVTGGSAYSAEIIKARSRDEADKKARTLSLEMGADWMLTDVSRRYHHNVRRLEGQYKAFLVRQRRGHTWRHLFPTKGRKRRKLCN